MTRSQLRLRSPRLRFLTLPDDPDAAFRVRAAADHAALLRLGKTARRPTERSLIRLEEIAHGLAGTGGVFGFPKVSTIAAKLERLAARCRRLNAAAFGPDQAAKLAAMIDALVAQLEQVQQPDTK